MANKRILNEFNVSRNRAKQVYDLKCRCLPKENRKEYKEILKTIIKLKNY